MKSLAPMERRYGGRVDGLVGEAMEQMKPGLIYTSVLSNP